MNSEHNVRWSVSLSNGETLFEGRGDYKEIPGELSPWQRLQNHLVVVKAEITSMGLLCENYTRYNLPSRGTNPKFHEFHSQEKPLDFELRRKVGQDRTPQGEAIGEPDLFTTAVAIYPDYELQIWINEKNPEVAYSLVVDKR